MLSRLFVNVWLLWQQELRWFCVAYTLGTISGVWVLSHNTFDTWFWVMVAGTALETAMFVTTRKFQLVRELSLIHALLFCLNWNMKGALWEFETGNLYIVWQIVNLVIHLAMFWYAATSVIERSGDKHGNSAHSAAA